MPKPDHVNVLEMTSRGICADNGDDQQMLMLYN